MSCGRARRIRLYCNEQQRNPTNNSTHEKNTNHVLISLEGKRVSDCTCTSLSDTKRRNEMQYCFEVSVRLNTINYSFTCSAAFGNMFNVGYKKY